MLRNLAPAAVVALCALPVMTRDIAARLRLGARRRGLIQRQADAFEEENAALLIQPAFLAANDDEPDGSPPALLMAPDETDNGSYAPSVGAVLVELGYPAALDRSLPPRAREAPAVAADRFFRFLLATSEVKAIKRMGSAQVYRLYAEFCWLDHRMPVHSNFFLGCLKLLPGVEKIEIIELHADGKTKSAARWTFTPPPRLAVELTGKPGRPKGLTNDIVKARAKERRKTASKRMPCVREKVPAAEARAA